MRARSVSCARHAALQCARRSLPSTHNQRAARNELRNLWRRMCESVCGLTGVSIILLLIAHTLTEQSILRKDHELTQSYTAAMCSRHLSMVLYEEGSYVGHRYARAEFSTTYSVLGAPSVLGVTRTVHLYYPPFRHWQVARASRADVSAWCASMMKYSGDFLCHVDTASSNDTFVYGVERPSDDSPRLILMAWALIAMTVLCIVALSFAADTLRNAWTYANRAWW